MQYSEGTIAQSKVDNVEAPPVNAINAELYVPPSPYPTTYAQEIIRQPQPEVTPTVIRRIVYVTEEPADVYRVAEEDQRDALLPCAIVGFCFSWIPIIGCLTYCINADAPQLSQRRLWANAALTVALIVTLFNLIFWLAFNY